LVTLFSFCSLTNSFSFFCLFEGDKTISSNSKVDLGRWCTIFCPDFPYFSAQFNNSAEHATAAQFSKSPEQAPQAKNLFLSKAQKDQPK
jgi:hypothetical protein